MKKIFSLLSILSVLGLFLFLTSCNMSATYKDADKYLVGSQEYTGELTKYLSASL